MRLAVSVRERNQNTRVQPAEIYARMYYLYMYLYRFGCSLLLNVLYINLICNYYLYLKLDNYVKIIR